MWTSACCLLAWLAVCLAALTPQVAFSVCVLRDTAWTSQTDIVKVSSAKWFLKLSCKCGKTLSYIPSIYLKFQYAVLEGGMQSFHSDLCLCRHRWMYREYGSRTVCQRMCEYSGFLSLCLFKWISASWRRDHLHLRVSTRIPQKTSWSTPTVRCTALCR